MASSLKDDSGGDGDKPSGDGDKPTGHGGTSAGDVPASNLRLFSVGDRVLAYDGHLLYDAKVLKVEHRKNGWSYFVHYIGWNKRQDKWVGTDKVMELTDENISMQMALRKELGADKKSKFGRSAQTKPKSSTVAKGKKCKGDSSVKKNDLYEGKLAEIQIPSMLKKQLVDDGEFVNQQDKLVKLPRSPNVDEILAKYKEYVSEKDPMNADSVGEILKGIRSYFEKSFPMILLYEKERSQFCDATQHGVSPSTIYGAEHLLRLFVKLPELLKHVKMEEETLTSLQQILLDFLKFLEDNQSTFFLSANDGSKASEGKGKGKAD